MVCLSCAALAEGGNGASGLDDSSFCAGRLCKRWNWVYGMSGGVLEAVSRRSRRMVVRLSDIAVRFGGGDGGGGGHACTSARYNLILDRVVTGHTPC